MSGKVRFYYGAPPSLQNEFVKQILSFLKFDELEPILVIVPSNVIARHLKKCLIAGAVDKGFINIHFRTLEGLAYDIYRQSRCKKRVIPDPDFYIYLVIGILQRQFEDNHNLAPLYFDTIRDMRDALVDTNYFKEFITESFKESGEEKSIESFADIFEEYDKRLDELEIADMSEVFKVAVGNLDVTFYNLITIYGYYDSTQAQFDLIHSLISKGRNIKTDVYVPVVYKKKGQIHKNHIYAEEFLNLLHTAEGAGDEKILLPAMVGCAGDLESEILTDTDFKHKMKHNINLIESCGTIDEVWGVSKVLLALIEEGKVKDLSRVAVVARDIQSYLPHIQSIFAQNGIPFWTDAELPINNETTKATKDAIEIFRSNFRFRNLVDLLTSPSCKIGNNKFEAALRELETTADIDEYIKAVENKLTRYECAEELKRALEFLKIVSETPDSWKGYSDFFKGIIVKLIADNEYSRKIRKAIDEKFLLLSILDDKSKPTPDDAFRMAQETIDKCCVEDRLNKTGVAVLGIMSARNLVFDTTFLVGLNNDKFPRRIIQDPLLSDNVRRGIRNVLGNKIQERGSKRVFKIPYKESAHSEEVMLFYQTFLQTTKDIYLCYQETDEKGRTLQRSVFLDVIEAQIPSMDTFKKYHIKRHSREKLTDTLITDKAIVTPIERMILTGECSYSNISKEWLEIIEKHKYEPDGLSVCGNKVGNTVFHEISDKNGFSATSISALIKCPFMFVMKYIFKIGEFSDPEGEEDISARNIGIFIDYMIGYLLSKYAVGSELSQKLIDESINKAGGFAKSNLTDISETDIAKVRIAVAELFNSKDFQAIVKDFAKFEAQKSEIESREINGIAVKLNGTFDIFARSKDPAKNYSLVIDTKWSSLSKLTVSDRAILEDKLFTQHVIYPLIAGNPENVTFIYLNLRGAYELKTNLLFKIATRSQYRNIINRPEFDPAAINYIARFLKLLISGVIAEKPDKSDFMSYCTYCNYNVNCMRFRRELMTNYKKRWYYNE